MVQSGVDLKARRRTDYGFFLTYRTRWYVAYPELYCVRLQGGSQLIDT